MAVQWTEEQQKVIDLRDRNILVSAAAGSGKTAVLVERIIHMLLDEERPVDVDHLLVVTFTEAAAAEMKERIREAIERELEGQPGNPHLQRQETLIHSAQITTIHSFCLSVIREHFPVIDLDPGFRIAEEGELKLLKQDVLEEMLEDCYREGEREFLEFTEKYSAGRSDKKIEDIILKLYEYSLSYPQPEKWLSRCEAAYDMETVKGQEPDIFQKALEQARKYLADMEDMLKEALGICTEPDGPYMYLPMLENDIKRIRNILKAGDFAEAGGQIAALVWDRLSPKKDENVSGEKKEQVREIRKQVKKYIEDLKERYFYESMEEQMEDMRACKSSIQILARLVRRFGEEFATAKRSRSLIDFNDMETFALAILTEEQDGALVPSPVAEEYQEQFQEVMIDEYQDSNLIQEAILKSVSRQGRGENNLFMVGDVKQSIYRFRLSRPELFMEKYDAYRTEDGKEQRIDLHRNFRSRPEVLESVNFVFEQIMRKDLGGVSYDENAALYPGASFAACPEGEKADAHRTELLLVDQESEQIPGRDEKEKEAYLIAGRIKELIKEGRVLDTKAGEYREVQYRDIVILTRSVKGWAKTLSAVLAQEGIPAYSASKEGYFETYEISVLLDYLKILDNYCQDLPLTAVLTSPFLGLHAQELAEIRTAYPDMPFYAAVSRYVEKIREREEGERKPFQARLLRFYDQLEKFRSVVPYTPIHELLWKIMEETGYQNYISAMPGGGQRAANLNMLVERAAAFENTSYKGLFHFVRYIEQMKKYDVDYGEAGIEEEQSDTVRIMSIHKSKGLEFPVVFVAGLGRKFNMQDVTGGIVLHPQLGVGLDAVDLEKRTKIPSFIKKVIQREVLLENLGEELRILYVAMTRAKEKLILMGGITDAQERIKGQEERRTERQKALPFLLLAEAKNYLDWILPAVREEGREGAITVSLPGPGAFLAAGQIERQADALARDVLENWDTQRVYLPEYKGELAQQLEFDYPYKKEGKRQLKFTVSELKKRTYLAEEAGEILYEEPEPVPLIPRFAEKGEELWGASRGSAYHKLMELLDFTKDYDGKLLEAEIKKWKHEKKLSEEMADCVHPGDILYFLQSRSGQRMACAAKAGKLYREQPFVLGVKAEEIYPDGEDGETILVQGIIDAYFEEEDGLVVLDYKTDRVRAGEELREKYHAQLEYYAEALEKLLLKPVKEKIIYSFALRQEIIL